MPPQVQLICGADDYLVEQKARAIVNASMPEADRALGLEVLDGRVDTKDAVQSVVRQCIEAVQTSGFFGGGKLVWLKNATFLNPLVRPGESEDAKKYVAELTACIKKGLPEGQRLLITSVTIARNTAFFKACQTAGEVSDFGSDEKSWEVQKLALERLNGQLRENHLKMSEEVCAHFLLRTGTSSRLVINELEKLRLYLGNTRDTVTPDDVDAIVCVGRETMAWDLSDAVGDRDPVKLMQALRRLKAQNENAIGLVTIVEMRVRELLVLRHALDQHWLEAWETDRGPFCKWKEHLPVQADQLLGSLPRDPRKVAVFIQRKAALQATKWKNCNELRRARHELIKMREKLVSSSTSSEILLETTLLRIIAPRDTQPTASKPKQA